MAKKEIHWRAEYKKLAKAVGQLEATIASQAELLRIRHGQLEQAQKAVDQTKQTMRQAIGDNAKTVANLNARIAELMNKLKELGFADFDNLGN
jgi:septal ring factor EnvC (AmiA/AmiB activator)